MVPHEFIDVSVQLQHGPLGRKEEVPSGPLLQRRTGVFGSLPDASLCVVERYILWGEKTIFKLYNSVQSWTLKLQGSWFYFLHDLVHHYKWYSLQASSEFLTLQAGDRLLRLPLHSVIALIWIFINFNPCLILKKDKY